MPFDLKITSNNSNVKKAYCHCQQKNYIDVGVKR